MRDTYEVRYISLAVVCVEREGRVPALRDGMNLAKKIQYKMKNHPMSDLKSWLQKWDIS